MSTLTPKFIILPLFLALSIPACDDCAEVKCENSGICIEGNCDCRGEAVGELCQYEGFRVERLIVHELPHIPLEDSSLTHSFYISLNGIQLNFNNPYTFEIDFPLPDPPYFFIYQFENILPVKDPRGIEIRLVSGTLGAFEDKVQFRFPISLIEQSLSNTLTFKDSLTEFSVSLEGLWKDL